MALLVLILSAVLLIILLTARLYWHPLWALLAGCLLVGFGSGQSGPRVVTAIGEGFGSLLGKIGPVVVFGAVLGVVLEQTGGALSLANGLLRTIGRRHPDLAMAGIGALVSVPVFCDSGFIILSRLNGALARRTAISPATLYLSLAAGLYITHNLVPPTPGPVAAAGNVGAWLGQVTVVGLLASVPAILVGWWWSRRAGPRMELLDTAGLPIELTDEQLPPAWRALVPIILPVALLALGPLSTRLPALGFWTQPAVALALGAVAALLLLASRLRERWTEWTAEGIRLAGPILIITGAGGSFGAVLQATPIVPVVSGWLGTEGSGGYGMMFLLTAFALAALLKTAQGSSTSALVVASSVLGPLAPALGYDQPLELALLVTALGAGAMTVSHANDSYFWVVSQFSGMPARDAFRGYTTMTALLGITVLATVLLLRLVIGVL